MVSGAFVILLLVSAAPTPQPDRGHTSSHPAVVRPSLARLSDAYGTRARRRFAAYLRLRLLELREAGLERAAAVVERRLPIDALVPPLREAPTRAP